MESKLLGHKVRARKSCKNTTPDDSIYNLVLQLVIALTCSLISSYFSFFPSLSYSIVKQFLLNPSAISSLMTPKCLFIAMNIIVVILIAEWRLTKSSPPSDIYEEYVERRRSLQRWRTNAINNELRKKIIVREEKPAQEKLTVEEEEEVSEVLDGDGDDNSEDLNRRIEDFIARVNRRMRLEAQSANLHEEMANSLDKSIVVHDSG